MNKVYINGRIVPAKQAKLSIFDRSYLYGEGAFETLRCYDGVPAFLELHYKRLQTNCTALGIPVPFTAKQMHRIIERVLESNRQRNATVRITVSPQGKDGSIMRPAQCTVNVVAYARKAASRAPQLYARGAKLIIIRSVLADSPLIGSMKSTSYLSRMLARSEVQAADVDEGLMCNHRGHIVEGTATNLFIVKNNRLYTPRLSDGALPGITRHVTIRCAEQLNIPVREIAMTEQRIKDADEVFVTGSSTEILPIHSVKQLWRRKAPGPITRQIMQAYQDQLLHSS